MKKKIVIISGLQIFPPESGGQLRTANLARSLAKMGHQVSIYSLTGRKADYLAGKKSETVTIAENLNEYIDRSKLYAALQLLCYRLHLPPFWITLIGKCFCPREFKLRANAADTLIADFPYASAFFMPGKNNILNTHNVEWRLCSKAPIAELVKKIEHKAVLKADQSIFCSSDDLDYFQKNCPGKAALYKISNGIDTSRSDWIVIDRNEFKQKAGIPKEARVVLFTGSHFAPNTEAFQFLRTFANDNQALLSRLNLYFLAVGSVAAAPIKENHFIATAKVPAIYPYFQISDYAINPVISGSGTNIKMMEYLAYDLPVLTTRFGARGLELLDQTDCLYFEHGNLQEVLANAFKSGANAPLLQMAINAKAKNRATIDMETAVRQSKVEW